MFHVNYVQQTAIILQLQKPDELAIYYRCLLDTARLNRRWRPGMYVLV